MKSLIGALCAFIASACLMASLAVAFSTEDACNGTYKLPEPPSDDTVKTAICQLGEIDLPTIARDTCQLSAETADNAVRRFFSLPPFGNTHQL